MSAPLQVLKVSELDFALEAARWRFAETHAVAIASHWAKLKKETPSVYNGRVLLLGRRALKARADGSVRLEGGFFATDFADFVAWRDFGHPGEPVENCFSMAALRTAEGAFLLGEMAGHTVNAGKIYFPAGTPDPSDVFDGKVDLDASARRELLEETGIHAASATVRTGWRVVLAARRVACMKEMMLPMLAEDAKARIEAFLARDPYAELARIHIVRRMSDVDTARTPDFVTAYLASELT